MHIGVLKHHDANVPAVVTFLLGLYVMEEGCLAALERRVSVGGKWKQKKNKKQSCHIKMSSYNVMMNV